MKEKHPDTKDLLKQLNTFITDQFTLREIDALNYALPRVFRADQGEKVKELINAREVLIKARFDAKIKDLCKVADDKLRIKGLEEYADSFYNSNDLNYIKEVAGKLLNAPDKEKFDKFVDERVKYKLEE